MEITNVLIRKFNTEAAMKAIATVTFDNCLVVHDLKVIVTSQKSFIVMPSRETKPDKDLIHPINREFREYLESKIFEAYNNEPETTEKTDIN